jgi:protein-serine/threonine kinase
MSATSDPQPSEKASLPVGQKQPSPPTSSAASTKSQTNHVATNKSPADLQPTSITPIAPPNGTVREGKQNTSNNPTAKKPTMTSRISGMFRRDGDKEKLLDAKKEVAAQNGKTVVVPPGVASSTSSSTTNKGTVSPANGSVEKSVEKKADEPRTPKRFWINQDGSHEHYLKVAKRHQKIKDMMRSLWGKKEGGEDQPLTLMHDWIMERKSESKASADLKGGPNQSVSLVEKYGKCQEIVGHGAFGIVRVAHKPDAQEPRNPAKEKLFAVKEFHKRPNESPKKYQKRLTSEFCISSSMQHPNVIQTLDLLQDNKFDYCEVMEYCAGGDLYTLILSAGSLEVVEADCYFKQLMRGVEYMHEMGVAHRDLKPENLLLTSHGALKITDFGNAECFRMAWEKEAHMTAGLCGSAPYIAPEEYVDEEFDPRAVDIWACGVIYMAMRTGRHLWRVAQKGEDEFFTRYLEDRKEETGFRPIEVLRRRQCRNVIYSVLDPNPIRRLTGHQVLQSEWIKDVKVCKAGEEGF